MYYLLSTVVRYTQLQKGYFPYGYWDSFGKLKQGVPSKDNFYNSLPYCQTSKGDYELDIIWKIFRIKNLKGCHNLNLKMHVLLLAYDRIDWGFLIRSCSLFIYSWLFFM